MLKKAKGNAPKPKATWKLLLGPAGGTWGGAGGGTDRDMLGGCITGGHTRGS